MKILLLRKLSSKGKLIIYKIIQNFCLQKPFQVDHLRQSIFVCSFRERRYMQLWFDYHRVGRIHSTIFKEDEKNGIGDVASLFPPYLETLSETWTWRHLETLVHYNKLSTRFGSNHLCTFSWNRVHPSLIYQRCTSSRTLPIVSGPICNNSWVSLWFQLVG